MSTYKIKAILSHKYAEFKSKKYRIIVMPVKGHMHVQVYGPDFTRKGLSNIKQDLTAFELKAVALYFAKEARDKGKSVDLTQNYAGIFGSCFE